MVGDLGRGNDVGVWILLLWKEFWGVFEEFDLIVLLDIWDERDEVRSLLIDFCDVFSLEIIVILFLLLFIVLGCEEFLDLVFLKVFGVISLVWIGWGLLVYVVLLCFLIFVLVFVFVFILFKLESVLCIIEGKIKICF